MSIEIIGMVGAKEVSESRGSLDGPQADAGYLARFAQAHENAGLDRMACRRVGVDSLPIRGCFPLDDVMDWGRGLVPLRRERTADTPVGGEAPGTEALTE